MAISNNLTDYPLFTAQALRYALASVLLVAGSRLAGTRIVRPRGRDWLWLGALSTLGLSVFNIAIVNAVGSSEPAVVAVVIGCSPLLLVVGDAIRTGQRPAPLLVGGAILVLVGAAFVQGGGQSTLAGAAWSVVALACEVAFTLLAVPVLGRLGPLGVATHSCWIAAAQLGVVALIADGRAALPTPSRAELFAILYLAVVLTALAFVLWYSAVDRIGPPTAGLFAGLIPLSAAMTGLVDGSTTVTIGVIGGAALVGAGIAVGLSACRPVASSRDLETKSGARSDWVESGVHIAGD